MHEGMSHGNFNNALSMALQSLESSANPYLIACNSKCPNAHVPDNDVAAYIYLVQSDTCLFCGKIAHVVLLGFHNARDARCDHHSKLLQHFDLAWVVCLK